MTAAETMTAALIELTDHEQRPPCAVDSEAWTSEDRDRRRWAARHCTGCPLLNPCAAVADEIHARFGVWGGTDRTPRPKKPRTTP